MPLRVQLYRVKIAITVSILQCRAQTPLYPYGQEEESPIIMGVNMQNAASKNIGIKLQRFHDISRYIR